MEGPIGGGVCGSVGSEALGSPAPPRGSQTSDSKRVLIVDDNAQGAECLGVILRLWGHDARVVYHGCQALNSAREYRPDVILLDIGLPGVDGYSLARTIRSEPSLRDVTLVAVTGYGREEDLQRAAEAGFDRHLLKPVELDVLEVLVAEAPRAA
jgi:CheY-like chemotaxis protein